MPLFSQSLAFLGDGLCQYPERVLCSTKMCPPLLEPGGESRSRFPDVVAHHNDCIARVPCCLAQQTFRRAKCVAQFLESLDATVSNSCEHALRQLKMLCPLCEYIGKL